MSRSALSAIIRLAARVSVITVLAALLGSCVPCRTSVRLRPSKKINPHGPFDLVVDPLIGNPNDQFDLNKIPRNPIWGAQENKFDPTKQGYQFVDPTEGKFKCFDGRYAFSKRDCVRLPPPPLCDLPSDWFHAGICTVGSVFTGNKINGHMNWGAATYEG